MSTNLFATREPGEPLHAGKTGSNSVWYVWTPGQANRGIATFSTAGSTFDTLLAVYTGTSVTNLTPIASDDDSGGFLSSKVIFNAQGGVTYHIAVDGFNGATGRFFLQWSVEKTNANGPVITCNPANVTVPIGGNASFTVSANGSGGALSYQWYFDNGVIPGATNAFYSRTNVQPQDVGFYNVRVTGLGNHTVESLSALLEIGPFADVQSKDKPDDVYPTCAGSLAVFGSRARPQAAGGGASVAMGSIGSQILINVSTNNVVDCNTTNCGGIPRGTRYLDLTATAAGIFVIDTSGSAPHTRIWVCAKGTNNLDLTRTFLKCDTDSAPDGRSLVRINAEAGRSYQVWISRLDDANGIVQLNWSLGLPPVLFGLTHGQFLTEGSDLTLVANATNIVASSVTTPLATPGLQWFFNGTAAIGNASPILVPSVTAAGAGQYTVVASNVIGSTSAIIRVEVHGPVESKIINHGGSVELFADDSMQACPGSPPASYQWNLDGVPLLGQASRSLVLRDIKTTQAGTYSVTVINCFGANTYTNTLLSVTVDVGFLARIDAGGKVTLTWQTIPTRNYQPEYRTDLASTVWFPLGPPLNAKSVSLSTTDTPSTGPRFYRIVMLDP